MEIKMIHKKIPEWIKKYKFIILVIAIGIILMLLPTKEKATPQKNIELSNDAPQAYSMEDELAEILCHIKGAGKVKVMLTVAHGEEVIYQTDCSLSADSDSTNENTDTVTVTDANRNQNGLIRQTNPPVYLGAIVICQGADDPIVKLAITEAVAKVTGLKSNCISVLKMK